MAIPERRTPLLLLILLAALEGTEG